MENDNTGNRSGRKQSCNVKGQIQLQKGGEKNQNLIYTNFSSQNWR